PAHCPVPKITTQKRTVPNSGSPLSCSGHTIILTASAVPIGRFMLNDIRYAVRTLGNNRGLALTAIISIGLAIGVTSSIFSFLDSLVLRPLNIPENRYGNWHNR